MVFKHPKTLAILGYHKIGQAPGGWDTWFYISEQTFVDHLRYLREHRWQVISAAEFVQGLITPEVLPERAALITFDDGCRQFLDVGLPWLKRFHYASVHFIPTDHIGGTNAFDEGIEPQEPIFTWPELRELPSHNVSIQSHAASHRAFSGLTESEKEQEILSSKSLLERELGRPIDLFAFPQGDEGTDRTSVGLALRHAGYKAAFLYGGGPSSLPVENPYRLSRIAMGPDTDLSNVLVGVTNGAN